MFSKSVTNLSVEDAVRIILEPHQNVCTQQPIGCHTSSAFVVELSKLDDCDDIKADDLGVWKNQVVRSTYCSIKFESEDVKKITVLDSKPAAQLIEQRTRKPPVLFRPMLIHQKKQERHTTFLVSGIVGRCPNLRGLIAFGTDGEKVIGEAF